MKLIPLTQGQHAIVDDEDYDFLTQWKWKVDKYGYATRSICNPSNYKKSSTVKMHRIILDAQPGEFSDHINGNRLDNQRSNLRKCTRTENNRNAAGKTKANRTSPYKGVLWHKKNSCWRAVIRVNQKQLHLGVFTDPIEAAKTYDTAAREHYGAFARTNF